MRNTALHQKTTEISSNMMVVSNRYRNTKTKGFQNARSFTISPLAPSPTLPGFAEKHLQEDAPQLKFNK
ncbi:hypothetical protein CEXT_807781 [Caerostris extrusa]|uniref:Uncharacterized protein n=1 Tax=Caerostris extrusa TaxID=172846 RepID=A0AAV4V6H7_CAEEX|nr:hypothetical protein CEXT_807781 [Caerostris extrusa]